MTVVTWILDALFDRFCDLAERFGPLLFDWFTALSEAQEAAA